MISQYMITIFKCFVFVIACSVIVSCSDFTSQKVAEKKDTTLAVNADTPAITNIAIAGDYELPIDTLTEKPNRRVAKSLRDLPIKKVGELILSDSIKTLNDEVISFMLLDSLSAQKRKSRDFYFKVFNKIMDRSGGAMSDAIGDYALSYVESYPGEFLENSKSFSANRLETWASHIGIELFLSSGDPKDVYEKTTQLFHANCKGCDAAALARLNEFNKLIWTTIEQNKEEKQ